MCALNYESALACAAGRDPFDRGATAALEPLRQLREQLQTEWVRRLAWGKHTMFVSMEVVLSDGTGHSLVVQVCATTTSVDHIHVSPAMHICTQSFGAR